MHVGDGLYSGNESILQGFKKHFESLATASDNPNFDQKYHEMNIYEVSVIKDLVRSQEISSVTHEEILNAIKSINKGKAADIYGVTIEHILNAGEAAIDFLQELINQIFNTGEIPDILKTGLLTPVYKKKGEKINSVNYRGITVLPVVCKIIEAIIRNRLRPICDNVQNPYQRGFMQNASPLNSALIHEEFIRESKDNNLTAYIILLDAKAAFDVVDHKHMLRRLFQAGIQDKHWTLIQSLHENATSSVKWEKNISEPFDVAQGVRQGGILSADLYKLYANPVMDRIQMSNIGGYIGKVLCNQRGCADDLTLNTNSSSESQVLTDIAVDNSDMERFQLQVKKSVEVIVHPKDKHSQKDSPKIYMRDEEMSQVDSATHLGIIRSSSTQKHAN